MKSFRPCLILVLSAFLFAGSCKSSPDEEASSTEAKQVTTTPAPTPAPTAVQTPAPSRRDAAERKEPRRENPLERPRRRLRDEVSRDDSDSVVVPETRSIEDLPPEKIIRYVYLTNGNKMKGRVVGLSEDRIKIEVDIGTIEFPREAVIRVSPPLPEESFGHTE